MDGKTLVSEMGLRRDFERRWELEWEREIELRVLWEKERKERWDVEKIRRAKWDARLQEYAEVIPMELVAGRR